MDSKMLLPKETWLTAYKYSNSPLDEYIEICSAMPRVDDYPRPEPYAVTMLRDRINIQNYFDNAGLGIARIVERGE